MEMGTVLRVIRDDLQNRYQWSKNHCRVVEQGEPLDNSPEFFVGITDGGTDGSPQDGFRLQELYRVNIWVWRRLGQYPQDRQGNAMIDADPHLGNIAMTSQLEREVKKRIHMSYALIEKINAACDAMTGEQTSKIVHPFVYQGSSVTQTKTVDDGGPSVAFTGRQLRFGGAMNIETICPEDHE